MTPPLLPTLNALLNGAAGLCLIAGRIAIARGRRKTHRRWMLAALTCSAVFLACYLYYHATAGVTRYEGVGWMRAAYFFILGTHTPLAGLMTPFILAATWLALRGHDDAHRRIVRYLWPVWLYVSVTGVVIYLMLYIW